MRIKIIKPGPFATIQDNGRYGYRHMGVPVAGCMDKVAAHIANSLVGNKGNEAVVEMTYGGTSFSARTPLLIACCGSGATLMADGQKLPLWTPLFIPENTVLSCVPHEAGCYSYLAIAGGWDVPKILGSRSTYLPIQLGGFHGRLLQKEDELSNNSSISVLSGRILLHLHQSNKQINHPKWRVNSLRFASYTSGVVRFIAGSEYEWFSPLSHQLLADFTYTMSRQSNRMGYHLLGPQLQTRVKQELLSTSVMPGTVQVTKSGEMILLMSDCQTTGGYPRIAQIIQADLPMCAQMKPGETIRFKKVSLAEAENLYMVQQKQLSALGSTIRKLFA